MTETAITPTHNDWLDASGVGDPPLVSERLIRALEAHQAASAADVAECLQLGRRMCDPTVDLLVGTIVADEQRHSALLHSMICRLQEDRHPTGSTGALPVPGALPPGPPEVGAEIAATLRGLIRNEREGSRHLRHLARQEPGLCQGLYPLLLETIARDAEKHVTVLRYLLKRVEASVR